MDVETARNILTNRKKRLEQKKIDKENAIQIRKEELVSEIKKLEPRIKKIIEIGNLCLENGINLNPRGTRKCLYEQNAYETDGIYHQLGFYPNNFQGYHGNPPYQCTHYEYIGYDMGGACGNINFITDGDTVASTPDHNGFEIISMSDPLNRHMEKFLRDFPKFEKVFYEFIERLQKEGE